MGKIRQTFPKLPQRFVGGTILNNQLAKIFSHLWAQAYKASAGGALHRGEISEEDFIASYAGYEPGLIKGPKASGKPAAPSYSAFAERAKLTALRELFAEHNQAVEETGIGTLKIADGSFITVKIVFPEGKGFAPQRKALISKFMSDEAFALRVKELTAEYASKDSSAASAVDVFGIVVPPKKAKEAEEVEIEVMAEADDENDDDDEYPAE
jgi:hypothetical protein